MAGYNPYSANRNEVARQATEMGKRLKSRKSTPQPSGPYSVYELARQSHRPVSQILEWIENGQLVADKVPATGQYVVSDLETWKRLLEETEPPKHWPLAFHRTDGKGRYLRTDYCTCEVSVIGWFPPEDWAPTDDTCPVYDKHLSNWKRERTRIP